MISLEKLKISTTLQKVPNNVGDLGKLIGAKAFEKLPNLVTLVAILMVAFSLSLSPYQIEFDIPVVKEELEAKIIEEDKTEDLTCG